MKKKELKELAKKIAKFELIVQSETASDKEIKLAQQEILELSSHVESLEDITQIDELVQDILLKNS